MELPSRLFLLLNVAVSGAVVVAWELSHAVAYSLTYQLGDRLSDVPGARVWSAGATTARGSITLCWSRTTRAATTHRDGWHHLRVNLDEANPFAPAPANLRTLAGFGYGTESLLDNSGRTLLATRHFMVLPWGYVAVVVATALLSFVPRRRAGRQRRGFAPHICRARFGRRSVARWQPRRAPVR